MWSVAEKRRAKLPKGKRRPIGGLAGGRLVAYMPEVNLCDGAAEYSSEGYFDVDNIPPWDTWVWYACGSSILPSHLVAWVPPQFIDVAQAGLEVNPEQCIRWFDEMKTSFAESLRRNGVLK